MTHTLERSNSNTLSLSRCHSRLHSLLALAIDSRDECVLVMNCSATASVDVTVGAESFANLKLLTLVVVVVAVAMQTVRERSARSKTKQLPGRPRGVQSRASLELSMKSREEAQRREASRLLASLRDCKFLARRPRDERESALCYYYDYCCWLLLFHIGDIRFGY